MARAATLDENIIWAVDRAREGGASIEEQKALVDSMQAGNAPEYSPYGDKIRWAVAQAQEDGASTDEQKMLVDIMLANEPPSPTMGEPPEGYQAASSFTDAVSPEEQYAAQMPTWSLAKLGMQETPEEKVARFKKLYPEGDAQLDSVTKKPIFRMPGQQHWVGLQEEPVDLALPGEEPRMSEPNETTARALARNSREIPRVAGSIAGSLAAAPVTGGASLGMLAASALGAGAGRLAAGLGDEAVEWAMDNQGQSGWDVALKEGGEAALETGLDLLGGNVIRYGAPIVEKAVPRLKNMFNSRVSAEGLDPADARRVNAVVDSDQANRYAGWDMRNWGPITKEGRREGEGALRIMREEPNAELPSTVVGAPSPLTAMVPNRVRESVGRQTGQFSEAISNKMDDVAGAVTKYAENLSEELGEDTLGQSLSRKIRTSAENKIYDTQPPIDSTVGGRAMQSLGKNWETVTKGQENALYVAARSAAQREQPVFLLDDVKAVATPRTVDGTETVTVPTGLVSPSGAPITVQQVEDINVVADPVGGLSKLDALVQRLDPEQQNYEVLKELRTQYGAIVGAGKAPDPGTPIKDAANQARHRYKALTNALRNPATPAPEFIQAITTASDYSAERLGALNTTAMWRVLNEESPSALLRNTAFSSEDLITTATAPALTQAARRNPAQAQEMAQAIRMRMLYDPAQPSGIQATQRVIKLENDNPELYNILGGDNLKASAYKWDEMISDPVMQVWRDTAKPSLAVDTMVKQMKRAADARKLLTAVGGAGSEGAKELRTAMVGTSLQKAMTTYSNKGGGEVVLGSATLKKEIAKLKKNGAWRVLLTEDDRLVMEGMSYILRKAEAAAGGDVGAALIGAATASQLKNPATFLSALGTIITNSGVGRLMMMPGSLKTMRRMAFGKQPLEAKVASMIDIAVRGANRMTADEE